MEAIIQSAFPRYRWTADDATKGVDLKGKHVIVTGATSGIGIPTAIALARTGCHLTFTARDEAKGQSTLAEATKASEGTGGSVKVLPLDLTSFASVRTFARLWLDAHPDATLDVLLHNAGVMATPFTLTEDKQELQMQVNFFSVALLTRLLAPRLTKGSRVVIVSSSAHRRIDPNEPFLPLFTKYATITSEEGAQAAGYDKWVAYAVAKSAAIMLANHLDKELNAAVGARVMSVHPGGILTGLQSSLSKEEMTMLGWFDAEGNVSPAFKSPAEGASTSVWCCVSPELDGIGGVYCENCAITPKEALTGAANDPTATLTARLAGTAPHVWIEADCDAVAAKADETIAPHLH